MKKTGLVIIIWLIIACAMIVLQNASVAVLAFGVAINLILLSVIPKKLKKFFPVLIIGIIILILISSFVIVEENEIVIIETPNQITVESNTIVSTCPFVYRLTYVSQEKEYNTTYGLKVEKGKMVWDITMKLKRHADKEFVLNLVKEYGIIGWQKRLYSAMKGTITKTIHREMHPENHLPLNFKFSLSNNEAFEIRRLGYEVIVVKAVNGRILK